MVIRLYRYFCVHMTVGTKRILFCLDLKARSPAAQTLPVLIQWLNRGVPLPELGICFLIAQGYSDWFGFWLSFSLRMASTWC
jgi:hypothetical protein